MYDRGGFVYVYLIYGMYWMLNVVTGPEGSPQAILIRGLKDLSGPGILTRALAIDKSFYGEDLLTSNRIWIENSPVTPVVMNTPRYRHPLCRRTLEKSCLEVFYAFRPL